ncbi:MAG: nucleotidyltransferase family protein, partial [Lachnospiraceae bacterium]|nr:nucleotidyltransferase family protein [Lachnospiraceae bacterium]
MKVAGVIAEFDPFHNGHAYFLRKVREITSADFIIVVMSGDFTQRGNIAIAGKRLRTETAIMNGADLVIELPVRYATASAELFAFGGVSILDALGCVDVLCFGTEEADLKPMQEMAGILADESDEFRERLDLHLRAGMNYPAARMEA